MIDGVQTKPLTLIPDERGYLMEILRNDDALYQQFGQAYLTAAYPGVVKAWHYHKKQTDHFCVVSGMAKVVLHDARGGSPTYGETDEFYLGDLNNMLISIPPGVYHGYKNIGNGVCLLLNLPTETYDYDEPDEYRVDPHDGTIPYDWDRKDG